MASKIDDIRNKVLLRIQDNKPVLNQAPFGALDAAILTALAEYQVIRPRERSKLITGNGGFDYLLLGSGSPIVADWQDRSLVVELIYPWDPATANPNVVPNDKHAVVRLDGDALYLRFFTAKPTASQQFLLTYSTVHTLNSSTSTVISADDEALADLAAAFACDQLAAYYSQTTDASIAVDSVNRIAKADSYRAQAKVFRASFKSKMEADVAQGPAAVVAQADTVYGNDVDRWFFHGRRYQ